MYLQIQDGVTLTETQQEQTWMQRVFHARLVQYWKEQEKKEAEKRS